MKRLIKDKWNLFRQQEGAILIDILTGVAILGFIGTSFMTATSTAHNSVALVQERVAAEGFVKSQIEYIKLQNYIAVADYNPSNPAYHYGLVDIQPQLHAAGYSIEINRPEIIASSGQRGFELQSVTVTVKRNNHNVFKISFYKRGFPNG